MALKTAAAGGIKVEIILPGIIDSRFVQYSARSYVQQLLRNDINVYFYQKGFIHAKILLIDDLLSMVGTANFDYRSFYQNFEINALLYDKETTLDMIQQFEKDKTDSEKLNLSKWRKRPINQKLFESLARLYAPLI
jgi:cardiolipin synthase